MKLYNLKITAKFYVILAAICIFVGLPLLLYATGETPRRTTLKDGLSILTLLATTLMFSQYFLARSNISMLSLFKMPAVQKVHKYIAYSAIVIMIFHPFFIVLPRFFEAGVKPWDAFWIMVLKFDSLGIFLGLFAWVAMITLGFTAYFRMKLMKKFKNKYRGWRGFHAIVAVSFTIAATWHAIELGRHTDVAMSAFFIVIVGFGLLMLARVYVPEKPKQIAQPTSAPLAEGMK